MVANAWEEARKDHGVGLASLVRRLFKVGDVRQASSSSSARPAEPMAARPAAKPESTGEASHGGERQRPSEAGEAEAEPEALRNQGFVHQVHGQASTC